ncbi:DUF7576 family protein [Halomicrococcus sp. SG-WS-1]|uniref:DUF7576 family protein n=1 Tax=Halomicrococcus sp. SG-WS-1 TaxID=3439057 RepID=UPI003F7A95FB
MRLLESTTNFPEVGAKDQYLACAHCENLVDIAATHPILLRVVYDDLEDGVTETMHFCSGDCRTHWKRESGVDVDD